MRSRSIASQWNALPRVVRFFVVGGVNTLFGYGAYAFLLFTTLHYAAAALLATVAGVTFNYFTTGRLVFDQLSGARLYRFVAAYCVLYCINVAFLAILEWVGLDPYLSGLLLVVPMALISYLLLGRFVFRGIRAAR